MSEENLDLDSVASQAMESVDTSTNTSTETSNESTVSPKEEQTSQVEKQIPKETLPTSKESSEKLSRRQAAAKEFADYRTSTEREKLETRKKLEEYQNKLKQFEPLMPYLTEIQKANEAKKKQDLANQYKTDPLATTEQRMQEMIQQAVQPYQQQLVETQNRQFVDTSINQFKKWAGSEEVFKEVSPVMANILDTTNKNMGTEVGDILARSPEFLFRVARDYVNEQKGISNNQTKQQQEIDNKASKAEIAKLNGGVSKPNRFTKTQTVPSRDQAKTDAYDFIRQITGQNK